MSVAVSFLSKILQSLANFANVLPSISLELEVKELNTLSNEPQASSDFIYAIIIEEYGLITGSIMLFLYMILLFRGIRILRDSEKTFGGLVAVGLSFSLVFQALINMAVAVNLFPVTGQPLPLVSMGGTSVWFTCISIGIILSISRSNEEKDIVAA